MPLTVGGGVRKLEDIRTLLLAGADKVSINTAAVHRPEFVARGGGKIRQPMHRRRHRRQAGGARTASRSSPMAGATPPASTPSPGPGAWSSYGAGEILLTSMDRDGTTPGLRHPLTRAVADAVRGAGDRLGRRRQARPSGRRDPRRPCHRRSGRLDLSFRPVFDRPGQGAHAGGGHPRTPGLTGGQGWLPAARSSISFMTSSAAARAAIPTNPIPPSCSAAAATRSPRNWARKPSKRWSPR